MIRRSRHPHHWTFASTAAGVAGVAAIVLLLLAPPASAKDPETQLNCPSDLRVWTSVTHDEAVPETRTPEELASSWRDATAKVNGADLSEKDVYKESETKTKIGYRGARGGTEAVLVYEKRPNGWRLVSIVECGVGK